MLVTVLYMVLNLLVNQLIIISSSSSHFHYRFITDLFLVFLSMYKNALSSPFMPAIVFFLQNFKKRSRDYGMPALNMNHFEYCCTVKVFLFARKLTIALVFVTLVSFLCV